MKPKVIYSAIIVLLLSVFHGRAGVLYVDVNNTNPVAPYAGWSTAATNIQDAIDVAGMGDVVLVTNGLYQSGGRVVSGILTNRVVINKAAMVQSVNGPTMTMIQGYQIPSGATNFDSDVRGVYMTDNAVLNGFTITGGATLAAGTDKTQLSGGGVYCETTNAVLTNCVLSGNQCASQFALAGGGAVYQGTLNRCTLSNNVVSHYSVPGGAAYASVLNDCLVISNSASFGGGAASSILNNCSVIQNIAPNFGSTSFGGGLSRCAANDCLITGNFSATCGGGDYSGVLNHCSLSNNACGGPIFSGSGGGSYDGKLYDCFVTGNSANVNGSGGGIYLSVSTITNSNCTIIGNIAPSKGGGVYGGTFNNCVIMGNSTSTAGGGAYQSTLVNCTIITNSANLGCGTYQSTLNNCISYYNFGGANANYSGGSINYSCTTPLPGGGAGNFTNEPLFISVSSRDLHLQSNSPCINSGNNPYVSTGNDLDGVPRIRGGTVDIGAYEYQTPGSIISYGWLEQYGLPIDGSADFADIDGTGMNNWQKWIAGLNPTNPASVLVLLPPAATNNPTGIVVSWQSVSTRKYYLQRSTNFIASPAFSVLRSNLAGQAGTTSFVDATATNGGPYFYRIGVQ